MTGVRTLMLGSMLWAAASAATAQALVINELMAVNAATVADEDGDFSDWLELYNPGPDTVALDGWHLSDNAVNLVKWTFPSVSIEPGAYLLVWASKKDRAHPTAPLHSNFKLSGAGEYLALVRPDGMSVEHEYAPGFPEQSAGVSWGLGGDFSSQRCFLTPTPGAENDESQGCGTIAGFSFSVEHGFFDAPFNVEISSSTPGVTIHYTTDASTPSETEGEVYTGAVPISTTTALRAVAFKTGLAATEVMTRSYIFLDDVIRQSEQTLPPGYPERWGRGEKADYDMDPDVVDDPLYAPEIKDDLKSVPTVSIVTDVDKIFGSEKGFYVHPRGRGVKWERPVSVELIHPDSSPGFQVDCGIRIQGSTSRFPQVKKHSMRLLFKSAYGPNRLRFPLFPDSEVESFNTLVLSAGHGNSWIDGTTHAQYLRDTWAKETQRDMGHLYSHNLFVHLYLNGIYWGMYRVTERPDSSFMSDYAGGGEDDWDVLKSGKLVDGDRTAWDELQDLADAGLDDEAAYQAVIERLDLNNFVDYIILNHYGANWDWDHHNWYAAGRRAPGGRFMFFSWDAEHVLENASGNNTNTNERGMPSSIYNNLWRENAEFRMLFADRIQRHMFGGGTLTREKAAARYLGLAQDIHGAIVGESARWGDKTRDVPGTRDNQWMVERQRILWSFFPKRVDNVIKSYRRRGIYPLAEAPRFTQHGGDFDAGFELGIKSRDGTVYYTDDGSDPRLAGGATAAAAKLYDGPISLGAGTTVSARALADGEWSALVRADFVLATPLRITEIMYNPTGGSMHEFVEVMNIGGGDGDMDGVSFTAGIDLSFGPLTLAPGQRVIAARDAIALENLYGTSMDIAGQYSGRLDNDGDRLRLADAGGNTVQDFRYDDGWHAASDGGGHSLVIRDPEAEKDTWSEASAWRASAYAGGSPSVADPRACGDGHDNDGDGLVDLTDPGCTGADGDIEDPECNDGQDNDGDGLVDLADERCSEGADASEAAPAVDPFLCYRASENDDGPEFERTQFALGDMFEGPAAYLALKPESLCLPGGLNGDTAHDQSTHLIAYKLREGRDTPRHQKRFGLRAENLLGPLFIYTKKTSRILVPSARGDNGPVAAPVETLHDIDHYKCYRMGLTRDVPKYFPSGVQVELADDYEDRAYRLKKPRHLCTPVDKDGGGIKNSQGFMLCYPTKPGKFESKHQKRQGVHTANSLGQGMLNTKKADELCLPARLI